MTDNSQRQQLALLAIAGGSIIALTWIALRALKAGSVDPNASALMGMIVTGLIAVSKDIIAAVRGYSMSAQLGKVTDQLAASGPATGPTPPDATAAADQVADAATTKADEIRGQG